MLNPEEQALRDENPEVIAKKELALAKEINHFNPEDLENNDFFLSGDSRRSKEWHKEKCENLITLCQIYDIKVEGLGVYGTCPVVFVDTKPSTPPGAKKFSTLIEYPKFPKAGEVIPSSMKANFDIGTWGVPVKKEFMGEWTIDL